MARVSRAKTINKGGIAEPNAPAVFYDSPSSETFWNLAMATAWIVGRDLKFVGKFWSKQHPEAGQKVTSGTRMSVRRASHAVGHDATKTMRVQDAWHQLLSEAKRGRISIFSFDELNGGCSRIDPPALQMVNEQWPMYGNLNSLSDGRRTYRKVFVRSAEILSYWLVGGGIADGEPSGPAVEYAEPASPLPPAPPALSAAQLDAKAMLEAQCATYMSSASEEDRWSTRQWKDIAKEKFGLGGNKAMAVWGAANLKAGFKRRPGR